MVPDFVGVVSVRLPPTGIAPAMVCRAMRALPFVMSAKWLTSGGITQARGGGEGDGCGGFGTGGGRCRFGSGGGGEDDGSGGNARHCPLGVHDIEPLKGSPCSCAIPALFVLLTKVFATT